MVEYYVDDLYSQIYVTTANFNADVAVGSTNMMRLSLADLPELPGTSKWYIRSVVFKCQGFQNPADPGNESRVRLQGGFLRSDIVSDMDSVEEFQDISGWPAKGVTSQIMIFNVPEQNFFSYTKTWRPSDNLTLNREQDISWCCKVTNGNRVTSNVSLVVHAERGD